MSVTSNTGPLIALAKVDRLRLLKSLYGEVFIPTAVYRELFAKPGDETRRLDTALDDNTIRVHTPFGPVTPPPAVASLGAGEAEAILLSLERSLPLLLDDRAARNAARSLGVRLTGTAGVLIEAKRSGLVEAVRPVLADIRNRGYWLSDELIETAGRLAGE